MRYIAYRAFILRLNSILTLVVVLEKRPSISTIKMILIISFEN